MRLAKSIIAIKIPMTLEWIAPTKFNRSKSVSRKLPNSQMKLGAL